MLQSVAECCSVMLRVAVMCRVLQNILRPSLQICHFGSKSIVERDGLDMYTYTYICMYINAYILIYIYTHKFICTQSQPFGQELICRKRRARCILMYICIHTHICMYVCIDVCIHIYVYVHICMYVSTHIHTHSQPFRLQLIYRKTWARYI